MNAIYLSDKPDNIIRVYTEETQARIASEFLAAAVMRATVSSTEVRVET